MTQLKNIKHFLILTGITAISFVACKKSNADSKPITKPATTVKYEAYVPGTSYGDIMSHNANHHLGAKLLQSEDNYTVSLKYKLNTRPYKIKGVTYHPMSNADGFSETGTASWYGPNFHGKRTACGEKYNKYAYTAAHKTLPFGTRVLVQNLDNGQSTIVVINDRGPFKSGRIIDLSYSAARDINMVDRGTANVKISVIKNTKTTQYSANNYAMLLKRSR